MANFSERTGLVQRVLQKDSMDEPLKNALWNAAFLLFWDNSVDYNGVGYDLLKTLWVELFHQTADEFFQSRTFAIKMIKERYMASSWASVYEFVEFIAQLQIRDYYDNYVKACNFALVKHVSAYRLVDGIVTPITSDEEIAAVEHALSQRGKFAPAAHHLKTALARFSDRSSPDYRNSVKESISAVESVCQVITGDSKATLGKALKQLNVHKALESGFSAIYGYTSDADGIRHALLEESSIDVDDARFFLVSCSAFVNYLISKAGAGR
jgi:hypothetical protein